MVCGQPPFPVHVQHGRDVPCGSEHDAPRVHVLLYAGDIVILSNNADDLQRALDAAYAWANAWRLHLCVEKKNGFGPTKSAFVVFGRNRAGVDGVWFTCWWSVVEDAALPVAVSSSAGWLDGLELQAGLLQGLRAGFCFAWFLQLIATSTLH